MADSKDSKKRKYTLFKADDGRPDHLKPCAFFASADGCKNGAKCRFLHGDAPVEAPSAPVVVAKASKIPPVVSQIDQVKDSKKRRKNDEEDDEPAPQSKKTVSNNQQESDQMRMLREQMDLQRQMFEQQLQMLSNKMMGQQQPAAQQQPAPVRTQAPAAVKQAAPVAAPVSASKKTPVKAPVKAPIAQVSRGKMNTDSESESESESESDSESESEASDDGKFLFDAVNHVLERGVNQTTPQPPKKPTQPVQSGNKATAVPTPGKSATKQPVTTRTSTATSDDDSDIFVNPQSKNANGAKAATAVVNPSKKKEIFATKANAIAAAPAAPAASTSSFIPEQVDFSAINYKGLVEITQSNRRFATDYNFSPDYTWVNSKQGGKGNAKVIAMDCEMCETTDPVTNEKETNSLVRFSVIDAGDPSRIIIDQLVCPTNPITDSRTRIHGITEEQLNSVKFTLRHAQAALLKLISEDTIIIGHSLHHDLKAMHIIHENVIDTAYLFSTPDPNSPNGDSIPSLRMLAEQVLQLRTPVKLHDSVEDSRISCYAAAYHVIHDGQFPTMSRGKGSHANTVSRPGQDESTLLVHHIPAFCGEEHIERLFASFTNIVPSKVNPISRTVDASDESQGKTLVHFVSAKHAELAFETLAGAIKPDKQNRPQKRVFLKNGSYVNVRK